MWKEIYEYMRVLATYQVNSVILPPNTLRRVLDRIKDYMKRNPRLQLPEDPDKNIWTYYSIMRITPIVDGKFLISCTNSSAHRYQSPNEYIQSA